MNVLLVDDDDLVRECFGTLLTEEGFDVTEAADAQQALTDLTVKVASKAVRFGSAAATETNRPGTVGSLEE